MWRRKGSALLNIGGDAACKVDPFDKPKLNWINCVRGGQRYRLQAQGDFCATAVRPCAGCAIAAGARLLDKLCWSLVETGSEHPWISGRTPRTPKARMSLMVFGVPSCIIPERVNGNFIERSCYLNTS